MVKIAQPWLYRSKNQWRKIHISSVISDEMSNISNLLHAHIRVHSKCSIFHNIFKYMIFKGVIMELMVKIPKRA